MKRFHKPGDEKRSVVIVPPSAYEDWLGCRSTDEARTFLNLYPAEKMAAEAYALPPRKLAIDATGTTPT
jgi:putative SOS response-associated peptidase YedK